MELYPPAPAHAPAASLPASYVLRVALVIGAIALFVAVYLGALALAGWGLIQLLRSRSPNIGVALVAAADIMLLVFLVKGLFMRAEANKALLLVDTSTQPDLFAFLRRLCTEAGCGFPKRVYLSHEVNASVFRRVSLLSALWPEAPSLHIGLGLASRLTVSELKAVLAHELGHFSQSSTKLGQQVYTINRVIYDMVVARDRWDRTLETWRRIPNIGWAASILAGIIWLLRKLLEQIWKLLNLASRSLSRAMEFDADALAVRLVGSDAIVSGLLAAERAGVAMDASLQMLHSLADHGKYSADLFHHVAEAELRFQQWLDEGHDDSPHLRALRAGYQPGPELHFEEGDDSRPSMWATHPSNREREIEAKREYVPCEPVTAPAERLLRDRAGLRRRLTTRAYEVVLGLNPRPAELLPPDDIERLAREEREEVEQAPHYHGLYANRVVEPGDLDAAMRDLDAAHPDEAALRAEVLPWTGLALAGFFARLGPKPAPEALGAALAEMKAADAPIFRYFYVRSVRAPEARVELVERYRFLVAIQKLIVRLNREDTQLKAILRFLGSHPRLETRQLEEVQAGFAAAQSALHEVFAAAKDLRLPRLVHMEDGAAHEFLPEPTSAFWGGARLDGEQMGHLLTTFGRTQDRLQKLHYKNLGALLRLQEQLDPSLYPPPSRPAP